MKKAHEELMVEEPEQRWRELTDLDAAVRILIKDSVRPGLSNML